MNYSRPYKHKVSKSAIRRRLLESAVRAQMIASLLPALEEPNSDLDITRLSKISKS